MDSEAKTRYGRTGRKEKESEGTSDRAGIADIVCHSVNLTQWGYRAKNVGENFHGGSPACLGICAAVEVGDGAVDSGVERSKDGGD